MGRVFQAMDDSGRTIAIKLLSPELSRSPDALERFKQEGIIASAISHPNCVFVHSADEDNGTPYIAMELMTGQTLKDYVAQKGPLQEAEAVALILQCIDGLVEAHSRGMIHRDIKPANCYLDERGNVKIGDFGLARSLVSDSELTRTGSFLGTPLYASPEQILGEKIDEQSDIYSLAATLYFLLAGRAPFESPNAPQVIAKIASADPPPFAEVGAAVSRGLEKVVLRGLERDRTKRFKTLFDFRNELVQCVAKKDTPASLGLRFIALMLDSTFLSVVVATVMLSLFGLLGVNTDSLKNYGNLVGTAAQFLYFFGFESIFGTTLGKMLLNMRVIQPSDHAKPSWMRCLLRTTTYVVLMNIVEWLVGGLLLLVDLGFIIEGVSFTLASWLGVAFGCGVMYSTWRSSGKRQLLHDRISQTEVLLAMPKVVSESIVLNRPNWSLPLTAKTSTHGLPGQLGRYKVMGSIPSEDASTWLSTRDSAIERDAWIRYCANTTPEISNERKKCTRRTRMRYLESGTDGDACWDAFVSPDGAPVRQWFDGRHLMPWPVTRSMILDVTSELGATEAPAVEQAQNIDCWWISSNGKATLAEIPMRTDERPPSDSSVFQNIARLAIPERDSKSFEKVRISQQVDFCRANIPTLRTFKLLQDIKLKRLTDPLRIVNEIHKIDLGPQSVSIKMRVVHAGLLCILFAIPAACALAVLSMPAIIKMAEMQRDSQRLTNLAALLKEPERFEEQLEKIEPEKRARLLESNQIQLIEKASDDLYVRFRNAFSRAGYFERMVVEQQSQITGLNVLEKPTPKVYPSQPPKNSDKAVKDTGRSAVRISLPDTEKAGVEFRDSEQSIAKMVQSFEIWKKSAETIHPLLSSERINRLLQIWAIPFAVLLIWGTLTRGGLSHYFTGLALVLYDGRQAGFLRCFVRTFLFWLPFAMISAIVIFLDAHGVQYIGWTQQLRRLFFLLPLIYVGIAMRFPQRGPHDAMVGTYVVPR